MNNVTIGLVIIVIIIGAIGLAAKLGKSKGLNREGLINDFGDTFIEVTKQCLDIVGTDISKFPSFEDYKNYVVDLIQKNSLTALEELRGVKTTDGDKIVLKAFIDEMLILYKDKIGIEAAYKNAKGIKEQETAKVATEEPVADIKNTVDILKDATGTPVTLPKATDTAPQTITGDKPELKVDATAPVDSAVGKIDATIPTKTPTMAEAANVVVSDNKLTTDGTTATATTDKATTSTIDAVKDFYKDNITTK